MRMFVSMISNFDDSVQIFLRRRGDSLADGGLSINVGPGGRITTIGYKGKYLHDRMKGRRRVKMSSEHLKVIRTVAQRAIAAKALGIKEPEFDVPLVEALSERKL